MPDQPVLNYGSAPNPRKFMRLSPLEWLVILGIIALLISIILPTLDRMRERSSSIPCASNLKQIGMAIQLYAQDNHGAFPPDLPTVLLTQSISADVFVCRHSSETRTKASTVESRAADLMAGHCSYIYVGRHFTTKTNPECVLAFEDPANNGLEGSFVLFADGHVEYMNSGFVAPLISEFEQGYNPPRPSALTKQQYRDLYQRTWLPKLPAIKSGQWSASLPAPATHPTTQPAQ